MIGYKISFGVWAKSPEEAQRVKVEIRKNNRAISSYKYSRKDSGFQWIGTSKRFFKKPQKNLTFAIIYDKKPEMPYEPMISMPKEIKSDFSKIKKHQFQCYQCREYFDEGSEEEALEELKENFGKECKPEDCEVFCDNCYEEFMKTFKIH